MALEKSTKIKIGLGLLMVTLAGFTFNYLMKQIRLLVNTKFDMAGTSVDGITASKVSITLWWEVTNDSDFTFTVTNQVYDCYLNDVFIKKVGASESIDILAHGKTKIPTYVVFTVEELLSVGLKNLGSFLTKEGRRKLDLKVVGDFTIKTSIFKVRKIPFEFKDNIESIMNY